MVNQQNNLNVLQDKASFIEARLNDIAPEQGSLSWLRVLPIRRLMFSLSKGEFLDAIYRYEVWPTIEKI